MPELTQAPHEIVGIPAGRMPAHIAIIMDGNGRWARSRGLPRVRGHEAGARAVRDIVTESARLGLQALTLYSFSHENWKRPPAEVEFLMSLYGHYLVAERDEIVGNNIRLIHVGRRTGLPEDVLREMDTTIAASRRNTGMRLCLALNYGARTELVDAVRKLAAEAVAGRLDPEAIEEADITAALYTAGLPDPDLLIRTAGERRISNFLLWQLSYTEIFVSEVQWPDFRVDNLHEAIRDYAARDRRFGGLSDGPGVGEDARQNQE